ncbi:MAG: Type secretion system protein [Chthoniobacter sp.]|nr:Type secretion system protein [Chthoniobacter sp.]
MSQPRFTLGKNGSLRGFTLIEILLALIASVVIFTAIYGVFSNAVHLRDNATRRIRDTRLRERAVTVIRNDLENAIVSGGALASTLTTTSSNANVNANTPGYLKFTTTTARNSADELLGDVQEVSYAIAEDKNSENQRAGILTRSVDRNLLAQQREITHEQQLLSGVESFAVSFYDGQNWNPTIEISGSATLPEAVRVTIQQAALAEKDRPPAPIDIFVPWTTQRSVVTSGT